MKSQKRNLRFQSVRVPREERRLADVAQIENFHYNALYTRAETAVGRHSVFKEAQMVVLFWIQPLRFDIIDALFVAVLPYTTARYFKTAIEQVEGKRELIIFP